MLPGGGIDTKESAEAAAVREIAEECALEATITGDLGRAIQFVRSSNSGATFEKLSRFVSAREGRTLDPVVESPRCAGNGQLRQPRVGDPTMAATQPVAMLVHSRRGPAVLSDEPDTGPRLASLHVSTGKERSNGDLDCRRARAGALPRVVSAVLHHERPSWEGARTHVVHLVETSRSLRHRSRRWVSTDAAGRRRRARGSILTAPWREGGGAALALSLPSIIPLESGSGSPSPRGCAVARPAW